MDDIDWREKLTYFEWNLFGWVLSDIILQGLWFSIILYIIPILLFSVTKHSANHAIIEILWSVSFNIWSPLSIIPKNIIETFPFLNLVSSNTSPMNVCVQFLLHFYLNVIKLPLSRVMCSIVAYLSIFLYSTVLCVVWNHVSTGSDLGGIE